MQARFRLPIPHFIVMASAALLLGCVASAGAHAAALDTASFLARRGAERIDATQGTRSPSPELAPLVFTGKGNAVPTCGVLVARPRPAEPEFVELVGPEPGEDWPYCMGILSMTPFTLRSRQYIAVEYLSRETREDVARYFTYLVQEAGKGFAVDERIAGQADEPRVGATARPALGVRAARMAALKNAFPQWRLQERDFISDNASSFAIFDDTKSRQCHVVAEAGAAPQAASLSDYFPGMRCDGVLAASRLARPGKDYYIAMFRSDGGKQVVSVTSIAADGKIAFEKDLAAAIAKSGATGDIKRAKAALATVLH